MSSGRCLGTAAMKSSRRRPNPVDIHVGSRVRSRRAQVGMSQEKLGDRLEITFQQIQKYEKGINRISASRLQHIARVLTVPVSYFFEDAPGPPARAMRPADAQSAANLVDFLQSDEGGRLNNAFARIKDQRQRRRVIDMVRAIAASDAHQ